MATTSIPRFSELLLPTLKAVEQLGGSGSISEIVAKVIELEHFTEAQQALPHNDGPETKIGYRVAWARTYLKYFGLLTNSSRGVWALTEEGDRFLRDQSTSDAQRAVRLFQMKADKIRQAASLRAARSANSLPVTSDELLASTDEMDSEDPDESLESVALGNWRERVISTLTSQGFTPAQFERLAQRLLREADFETVTVTGRSGDQGIDGVGVYRMGLLTFPIFFQCKRYSGTVGPGEVRDFRGAMQGRGEKGLLITTGRFTSAAKAEATRDGATPIDLVDGERLCELLRRYDLGVHTRMVEEIVVDGGFFAEI